MVAILAWIALLFEMSGNWFIGSKYRWGFLVKIFGSIAWFTVAILSDIGGLATAAILGLLISARSYRKWGRK